MPSQLKIQKQLELRRRSLAQRQLALGQNIMLAREIRKRNEQAIIQSQRIHLKSQLTSFGENNPQLMRMKYERIAESIGLEAD